MGQTLFDGALQQHVHLERFSGATDFVDLHQKIKCDIKFIVKNER